MVHALQYCTFSKTKYNCPINFVFESLEELCWGAKKYCGKQDATSTCSVQFFFEISKFQIPAVNDTPIFSLTSTTKFLAYHNRLTARSHVTDRKCLQTFQVSCYLIRSYTLVAGIDGASHMFGHVLAPCLVFVSLPTPPLRVGGPKCMKLSQAFLLAGTKNVFSLITAKICK